MDSNFLENLTLGEMAFVERTIGLQFDRLPEAPRGLMYMALAVVIKKRQGNPAFTLADAENLSMDDINALLESVGLSEDSAADPKE